MSNTRNESVLVDFGKNLQKIRKKKGISLRQLEILSEVDFSEIHRLEKGKRNPTLTVIIALAKGLKIERAELLNF
ncbi:helix-turn-helix transcriptional regulator [Mucilaginibacter sabulilitoris]|uniref:Helix-turn-helix transcriptional regulator n=1 Tax=Mucilaginibacter sabulilitoris TaxID=1173583 RepID=A0ABZ0TPX0_9SPHI|nr:helix-turn-helix transcriptional regulator [Mucilaginibacter sabulilitoris]WPU94821.1 helix-turn-helix transcriptional regulator [Mucilaginibacter sabulilitoris]